MSLPTKVQVTYRMSVQTHLFAILSNKIYSDFLFSNENSHAKFLKICLLLQSLKRGEKKCTYTYTHTQTHTQHDQHISLIFPFYKRNKLEI